MAGRQTATSGKPAWAVEADRLWTDLLQELALAAGDAIAVESLDELESLEQAS